MVSEIHGIITAAVLVAMVIMGLAVVAEGRWQEMLSQLLAWRERRSNPVIEVPTPSMEHSIR